MDMAQIGQEGPQEWVGLDKLSEDVDGIGHTNQFLQEWERLNELSIEADRTGENSFGRRKD